ncbi:MAG: DUF1553 domain-containing protein [Bacteroidota bacterium]
MAGASNAGPPCLAIFFFTAYGGKKKIDFNTQVKPIINKRCISCHGGVKKNGELSMMTRNDLLKSGESGHPAIVPGDPEGSELYQRLITEVEEDRMPYEADALPKEEIKILKQWIAEGAEWGMHWALIPVAAVEVPGAKTAKGAVGGGSQNWAKSPIDHFVLEEIKAHDLQPSPQADKKSLLRRLSLDLIGMPAPDHLAETYLSDDSPEAYEALVDSLMASKKFGEKWASMWMDLARYSDTKGPVRDLSRSIWEYRDWIIKAFNQDMPYDIFLRDQIAGDLLPNPTDAQYIATGFHRNTNTNDEGGTDNNEFRAAAVVDRVNTTWEALLGTTFSCVQCHGHPYDPINHEEFYQFMAFLDNTRDHDTFADYPWLRKLSEQDQDRLAKLRAWVEKVDSPERGTEIHKFVKTWQPVIYSLQADSFINAEIYDTKFLTFRNNGIARLPDVGLEDKDYLTFRYSSGLVGGQWTLHLDSPNGPQIAKVNVQQSPQWKIIGIALPKDLKGRHDLFFKYKNARLGNSPNSGVRFDWFHFGKTFPGKDDPQYQFFKDEYWSLVRAETEHTLIVVENPKDMWRETRVWDRGSWVSQTEVVEPAIPRIFNPLPEGAPNNRIGLAQWLVDKQNPLTSRTIVNRIWEQLMGKGLVETLEDLGTQGFPPTHPELLEYLSWQMMNDYEWSMKRLIKEIVRSATYQQTTFASAAQMEKDPKNAWYGRTDRIRLSAEQVRDQALTVSGLLSEKMYGPGVMPFQPDAIWNNPYNSEAWVVSEGEDKYRRAVYTFWKRTAPYPAMLTFDAASRDVCSPRRIRTNTPLQALVTMNDPSFFEAAIHLAKRSKDQTTDIKDQIRYAYHRAIGQEISDDKLRTLINLYKKMQTDYAADQTGVLDMLEDLEEKYQTADMAALSIVANTIMNLDEFITRS